MSLFGKAGSKVLAAAAALTLPFSLHVTAPAFAVDATQSEDEATTAEASPSLPDVESAASAYPFGYVDSVSSVHGGVMVRGWAIDPDTRDAIQVHVYSGGVNRGATWANESRPDVDSAHKDSETGAFEGCGAEGDGYFEGWFYFDCRSRRLDWRDDLQVSVAARG